MTLQLRSEAQGANEEAKREVQEGWPRRQNTICHDGGSVSNQRKPGGGVSERGLWGKEGTGGGRTWWAQEKAPLLVILVCYSENNGETSCFGEIVPAVSWRMD